MRIKAHFGPCLPGSSSCLHPAGLLLKALPAVLAGAPPQLPEHCRAGPGRAAPTLGKPLLSSHEARLIALSVPLPSSCSGQDRQPRQSLAKQPRAAMRGSWHGAAPWLCRLRPRCHHPVAALAAFTREPTSPRSCLGLWCPQAAGACGARQACFIQGADPASSALPAQPTHAPRYSMDPLAPAGGSGAPHAPPHGERDSW